MSVGIVLVMALMLAQVSANAADWNEVEPRQGTRYVDPSGKARELFPSCSGGPVCAADSQGKLNCELADSRFSFFFKAGDYNPATRSDDGGNLLIYLDQGGACWDEFSCIASAETAFPAYAPAIDRVSISYAQDTGIMADRADNPFQHWTKLFIPACTADVFWGSNDAWYLNAGIDGEPLPGIDNTHLPFITIHHRGFDNFLSALRWARRHLDDSPRKVVVAGSSAGGYGAVTGFAFAKEVWPTANTYMISDAANGVIDSAFTNQIIKNPASPWGQQGNMPTWIPGITKLPYTSDQFFPDLFSTLASYYTDKPTTDLRYGPTKVAQYTTEWDVDQVFYFGAMQEPSIFVDLFGVLLGNGLDTIDPTYKDQNAVYCGWHALMDRYTNGLVNSIANYRFYRAAGYTHTILTETPPFILPPEQTGLPNPVPVYFNSPGIFYSENSAGTPFNDWIRGMLGEPGQSWENQPGNITGGSAFSPPLDVICN